MIWIPIALIAVALLFFVYKSLSERSKANTLLNFFQYGRNFKKTSFFATLVSSNSALSASVYLIIVYGFFYGLGIFPWVLGFWLLTQITSVYTIKKVEKMTKNEGGFISKSGTLHEFLGKIFKSNRIRVLAGILSTITFVGLIGTELVLGFEIIRSLVPAGFIFLGFPFIPLLFLLVLTLIIVYYTSKSGFRAVVATDKIQLTLILVMIVGVLTFIGLNLSNFVQNYSTQFVPLLNFSSSIFNPIGGGVGSFLFFFVFMNLIFWGAWWPVAMDQWHRVAATKNVKSALSKGLGTLSIGSVLFFAILTFTFLTVGAFVRVVISPENGATQPIFYFLTFLSTSISSIIGWFGLGLVTLGLVALLISTIDTYLVVAGQSIISDIHLSRKYNKTLFELENELPEGENKKLVKLSGKIIILLSIPIILMFLLFSQLADVFTSVYMSFSFMMALIPPLLIAFFNKGRVKSNAIFYSMIGGGLWALVSNIYLILSINNLILSGATTQLLLFYNLLYANPPITAVITFIIYLLIPGKSKLGESK